MIESDELEPWLSFEQVSEATWAALRCCAADAELMGRLLEAIRRVGRLDLWIAGPAIAGELSGRPVVEDLTSTERDDLASLLAALINARFELYVYETMTKETLSDERA